MGGYSTSRTGSASTAPTTSRTAPSAGLASTMSSSIAGMRRRTFSCRSARAADYSKNMNARETHPRSVAALRAAMAELVPALRSRALAAEQAGRVPAESLTALREAGLFRIVQPRIFGGSEHDLTLLLELVAEAAED